MRAFLLMTVAAAAVWCGSTGTAQAQYSGYSNFEYVEFLPPTTWTWLDNYYDYVLEVETSPGVWEVYEIYPSLAQAEYWEMLIARRYLDTRIYWIWNPGYFIPIYP